MFRRRKGATIRVTINTNPKLITEDDLTSAVKQIHFLPPPNTDGSPNAEIQVTAVLVNTWNFVSTLLPAQTLVEGIWYAVAYATLSSGTVVKISKAIAFSIDSKYKYP